MNGTALGLVLLAAVVHAGWNLAAKRVAAGARFVFLYYTVSAVVCAPVAVVALVAEGQHPQWTWLVAALLTAVFHIAYSIVLQRGYRVGDLSVVYRWRGGADRCCRCSTPSSCSASGRGGSGSPGRSSSSPGCW